MRKKYVAYCALFIVVSLLFFGCDALISNAYKTMNLGQPDPAKLKNDDASALLEKSGVSSGVVSDAFIKAVISSTETKEEVIAKLEAVINDPGTPAETAQAAQTLIIDIEIADIGADILIDGFNEALSKLASLGGGDTEPEVADIIDLLIPESLKNDSKQLEDIIDNLANSDLASQIATLANLIGTDEEGKADNVVENLDYGTIAQTAVLILIVQNIEPTDPEQTPGQAVVAALEALNTGGDPGQFISLNKDDLTSNADLPILFSAAGASELYNKLMEGLGSEGSST